MSAALVTDTGRLLRAMGDAYTDGEASRLVAAARARLEAPLRVAIAGKMKAGKSTLLNALVTEELAPTDVGECTRIVTWYRYGADRRVIVQPADAPAHDARFAHERGALEIDLGGLGADDIDQIEVTWPAAELHTMTLIDTPGIETSSVGVAERTYAFLAPDDGSPAGADAIVYLMRHLHKNDLRFLEAFHDDAMGRPAPVSAIAVLSRADEIGAGRLDAMESAARIAARYANEEQLRHHCETVVPVAGLVAQAGATLLDGEYRALRTLSTLGSAALDELLLTTDRFVDSPNDLSPEVRRELLARFGVYGIRLAVSLIQRGAADGSVLASQLVSHSGVETLREALYTHFAQRGDLLKARSAIATVESVLADYDTPSRPQLRIQLERLLAGAHELVELELLNGLRAGMVPVADDERAEVDRLLGGSGPQALARLGLESGATGTEIAGAARTTIDRWRARGENPFASRDDRELARAVVRSCESLLGST